MISEYDTLYLKMVLEFTVTADSRLSEIWAVKILATVNT